jgi:hypothetical protein
MKRYKKLLIALAAIAAGPVTPSRIAPLDARHSSVSDFLSSPRNSHRTRLSVANTQRVRRVAPLNRMQCLRPPAGLGSVRPSVGRWPRVCWARCSVIVPPNAYSAP